jgi:cohesin complex subunit SA-1/2
LDADEIMLEEMDSEQWGQIVTDLVDDMRYTQVDHLLLCADPKGAVHAAAVERDESAPIKVTPSMMAVAEYRKIYEEFWYVLGTVALTEGHATTSGPEDDDDKTVSRFQTEMAENIILRVNELVTVGQPDVRAAAAIAAMQVGLAVLNRTVEIGRKLDVAMRQYNASKESASSRKAESLGHQMESLKRTKEDLEALVLGPVVQVVFMHRYRDSNRNIRAFALNSLSKMTLARPDIFLSDKYLKYLGWMLSDKDACVRCAALSGLLAPFQAIDAKKPNSSQIDLTKMENVISKFMNVIAHRAIDRNVEVQETAMALLLCFARHSFMDTVEDDNLWNQINLRALAPDASPAVRRDALYFVIDQLEAFDDEDDEVLSQQSNGGKRWSKDQGASLVQSKEKMIVQRLDALASW